MRYYFHGWWNVFEPAINEWMNEYYDSDINLVDLTHHYHVGRIVYICSQRYLICHFKRFMPFRQIWQRYYRSILPCCAYGHILQLGVFVPWSYNKFVHVNCGVNSCTVVVVVICMYVCTNFAISIPTSISNHASTIGGSIYNLCQDAEAVWTPGDGRRHTSIRSN